MILFFIFLRSTPPTVSLARLTCAASTTEVARVPATLAPTPLPSAGAQPGSRPSTRASSASTKPWQLRTSATGCPAWLHRVLPKRHSPAATANASPGSGPATATTTVATTATKTRTTARCTPANPRNSDAGTVAASSRPGSVTTRMTAEIGKAI